MNDFAFNINNINNLNNLTQQTTKENTLTGKHIHISIKQRTVRKCHTIVTQIPEDIDLKLVLREWKNKFNCAGAVKTDENGAEYIQLFGNHKEEIKDFLIYEGIGTKESIVVHGN